MIEETVKGMGKTPVAALLHQKGTELYFPEATGTYWRSMDTANERDVSYLRSAKIPFVDAKGPESIPTDVLKRLLSFAPIEIASVGLAGSDGKGHVSDWLALSDFIGAKTHWAARESQSFIMELYDPVVQSALSSFQPIPYMDIRSPSSQADCSIAQAQELLRNSATVLTSNRGMPETRGNQEALLVLQRILDREALLVSYGEKSDSDGIRSFVSQAAALCTSAPAEDFASTIKDHVGLVRRLVSQTNTQTLEPGQ